MTEKLFKKGMTLAEMDAVIEQFLTEEGRMVRVLTDIPLTQEEYSQLSGELLRMGEGMLATQRYRISMLVAWAYALHFGKEDSKEYHAIMGGLNGIPQYSMRQFLKTCSSTFEDFGLNTYFKEIGSKQQLCGMMVVQAGIPEELAPGFCRILDEMIDGKPVEEAMVELEKINNEQIENVADDSSYYFLENLLLAAREIMKDCQSGEYTEAEILKKYYITSSRLIHICWCWAQKEGKVCA